ncbi:MAG: hypothetical protein JW870_12775 [Candidatus Delongbacteria bacterium]|nr:hypothetical protein [Candidatus Delongbacteria bacterium]
MEVLAYVHNIAREEANGIVYKKNELLSLLPNSKSKKKDKVYATTAGSQT